MNLFLSSSVNMICLLAFAGQISKKPRLAVHAKKDMELASKIVDTIAMEAKGM